jgi:hypothetical protein
MARLWVHDHASLKQKPSSLPLAATRYHRLFIRGDASFFLVVGLLPELREAGGLVFGRSDAVHELAQPGRWSFGFVLREEETDVEHRLQEDEHAKEVAVRACERDGAHAANDGEVNDYDTAEALLPLLLNPTERLIPKPDQISDKIDQLEGDDANQSGNQMQGLDPDFRGQISRDYDSTQRAEEDAVRKSEDESGNEERAEVGRALTAVRFVALRRFVVPVTFARPDPAMEDDARGNEEGSD